MRDATLMVNRCNNGSTQLVHIPCHLLCEKETQLSGNARIQLHPTRTSYHWRKAM